MFKPQTLRRVIPKVSSILLVALILAISVFSFVSPTIQVEAADVPKFWIGGTGNYNDTAHWSLGSGGAGGAAVPDSDDTATIDDASGMTHASIITLNAAPSVGNFICTQAAHVLIQGTPLGTPVIFTVATTITPKNIDFMDVTAAGAASWDFSARTDVGDAGGNTGITFPATLGTATWDGTAGSASNPAKWDIGRIPLVGIDDVTIPTTGITFTDDMPRMGKSITVSGTGTIVQTTNNSIYGSYTLASGITHNNISIYFRGRSNFTITTAGKQFSHIFYAYGGTYTYQDNITAGSTTFEAGTVDYNGFNLTQGGLFTVNTTKPVTIYLRSGTFTFTRNDATGAWRMTGVTTLTFNAGTSTIIMSSSTNTAHDFICGGLVYNNVTVQGAGNYALTVTGSNDFNVFKVDASQSAKRVNFTDATTQEMAEFQRDSNITNVITLRGSGVGGWNLTKTNPLIPNALFYMDVDYCTATDGAGVWYMGDTGAGGSTDGGNNTNVEFDDPALTVVSDACTGVTMDKDGVTGGTFNGTISNTIHGTPRITTYFEYGLTNAYGAQTADVMLYADGAFTGTIPAALTPGATYHFRAVATNGNAASPFNGADSTFTFTMPTATTSATVTQAGFQATLNGNITNMGVASSTYASFEWGYDLTYGHTTANTTMLGIGAFSNNIVGYDPSKTIHFRALATNGATTVTGADQTFVPSGTIVVANNFQSAILPIVFAILGLIFLMALFAKSENLAVTLVAAAVLIYMYIAFLTGIQANLNALWGG